MTTAECSNIYVRSGGQWKSTAGAKVRSGGQWKNFKGVRTGDTWYVANSSSPQLLFSFRGNFTSETSSSPITMLRNYMGHRDYYVEIYWVNSLVATVPFIEDGPVVYLDNIGGIDDTNPTKTYDFKIYSGSPGLDSNITGIEITYIDVNDSVSSALFPDLKNIWFYAAQPGTFRFGDVSMYWAQRDYDHDWVLLHFPYQEPAIETELRDIVNRKGYEFVFEP